MQSRFRFRHLVGGFFLLYALAYGARPDVGIIAYASDLYRSTPAMLIALFGVCGFAMLLLPLHPPLVAFATLPLALMSFAYTIRAATEAASISWSGAVSHAFIAALILRWAWRRVQEGTDD